MSALLRPAHPTDKQQLVTLKRKTFHETFVAGFAIPYPPADRAIFEQQNYGYEAISSQLDDPEHMSWVVEQGGALIGYAHVGPCKLPHPDIAPADAEIYELYLLNTAQGLSLGTRLMDTALKYLDENRPGPVWLGVWSDNLKAQNFYGHYGFEKVGAYQFKVGTWRDDEFILRREAGTFSQTP